MEDTDLLAASPIWVLSLLVSFAVIVLLAIRLYQARVRLGRVEVQGEKFREVSNELSRMESHQQFVTDFLSELPFLMGELHSRVALRRVPEAILKVLMRAFGPKQAAIYLRCRATLHHPERDQNLILSACYPPGSIPAGLEVAIGESEVGLVAASGALMGTREFEAAGEGLKGAGAAGFTPDLVAPMEMGEEILGVVALRDSNRPPSTQRTLLRLVAQMAAFNLQNVIALKEIRSAADVDSLTGIFNRGALDYKLAECLSQARADRTPFSVLLFDVDEFKAYNDRSGHLAGDEALRLLARVIRDVVRLDDVFGRFGGEEFLLIFPDRTCEQAMAAAEKLRREVESFKFPSGDKQPQGRLTVSGGLACFPDHGSESAGLLRAADEALYRAKQSGRNRIAQAG